MRFCDWLIRNKDIYRESVFNDHLSLLQKTELLKDFVNDTRTSMYNFNFTTALDEGYTAITIPKNIIDLSKPYIMILNYVEGRTNTHWLYQDSERVILPENNEVIQGRFTFINASYTPLKWDTNGISFYSQKNLNSIRFFTHGEDIAGKNTSITLIQVNDYENN